MTVSLDHVSSPITTQNGVSFIDWRGLDATSAPSRHWTNRRAQLRQGDSAAVDIHLVLTAEQTKFLRQNLGLGTAEPIRDRKFEIGVDLAKERA